MLKILLSLLAIFIISGCASSTAGGVVGANRSQLMLVSADDMNKQSSLAYSEVLQKAKTAGTLDKDVKITQQVNRVAKRLIAQVGAFRTDARSWQWQVHTIDEDTLNAWCMPGGRIVVYSGIIKRLGLNDAELAAVLGHEMAHALREHSREQASSEEIKNLGLVAVASIFKLGGVAQTGLNIAAKYTFTLPFSRSHESEADAIGTELMARAGYDPKAAVNVWKKMQALSSTSTPEILSTHPSNQTRIDELSKIAQKLEPIYQNAKK
ncbi:M48 family metallopeptidase [Campylobacter sp. 19-13652]|uniref:M48 family metallopeptidase n=1 Tax=Campylobacter sp. 19-13652 TaxID=2840180 RepID=UPI001C769253|nr:M48 family metallopeptidase [Campylobacter sp. 19-13652]BCX78789.1 lipoprotein [Campylobacter sp. 19-13652]